MNETENTASETTNLFEKNKADEVSGRLSREKENISSDQLQKISEKKDLYEALKLAEGLEGQEENFTSFKQLASELNLPIETAQKLMDWEANICAKDGEKREVNRQKILRNWTQQTQEMFGVEYPQKVANALRAAQQFGGEELRQLLDVTGLGSHPVIVKTFHAISQQISEDASIGAKGQVSADKTFAEALYGKAV